MGGNDGVVTNISGGRIYNEQAMDWDTLSVTTTLWAGQAGQGGMIGNRVFWMNGDNSSTYNSPSGRTFVYDFLIEETAVVDGSISGTSYGVSLVTSRVGIDCVLDEDDVKLWSFGGYDGAVYTDIQIRDLHSNYTLALPIPGGGVTSYTDPMGATDNQSAAFSVSGKVWLFGENGRQSGIALGTNANTYRHNSCMAMFEGKMYFIGGWDGMAGTLAYDNFSQNVYAGSWVHHPKNFSTGTTAETIGASRGDIYGFVSWNNYLVYEATAVGIANA